MMIILGGLDDLPTPITNHLDFLLDRVIIRFVDHFFP